MEEETLVDLVATYDEASDDCDGMVRLWLEC